MEDVWNARRGRLGIWYPMHRQKSQEMGGFVKKPRAQLPVVLSLPVPCAAQPLPWALPRGSAPRRRSPASPTSRSLLLSSRYALKQSLALNMTRGFFLVHTNNPHSHESFCWVKVPVTNDSVVLGYTPRTGYFLWFSLLLNREKIILSLAITCSTYPSVLSSWKNLTMFCSFRAASKYRKIFYNIGIYECFKIFKCFIRISIFYPVFCFSK